MTTNEIATEIEDKLKTLYRITDHYVPLSQQGRFSEYDSAKEAIQELADRFIWQQEDVEKYKDIIEEVKDKVHEISDDMEAIDDIGDDADTDEDGNYIISQLVVKNLNADIAAAVKMLDKLYDKCDI